MWKKFALGILFIMIVQFWLIESYVELVDINKLPTKRSLDRLGAMQTTQLLSYDKNNIIGSTIYTYLDALTNEKQKRWHFEELNNRIRRSLENQGNIDRNPRQNDKDLNNNNNDEESFLESEPTKVNISTKPTSDATVAIMTSSGNNSYLPPPTGNPWKPEVSSYYPHQPSLNSYYSHQSTCLCQPVFHRPPPPYSHYQPPELAADAFIGYSYGPPTQGHHLSIYKPFPFSFEHGIYPGQSYFKPSRPDEFHGSYEAPKQSFAPINRNFLRK